LRARRKKKGDIAVAFLGYGGPIHRA